MNDHFFIVEGDRLPALRRVCMDNDGVFPLVDASSPVFYLRGPAGLLINGVAAVIENAAAGIIRYDWAANDTADPGTYLGWFKVTIGGLPISFPNDGFIVVTIREGP